MFQEVKLSKDTGCELYSGENCNNKGTAFWGHQLNWNLILTESGKAKIRIGEKQAEIQPGSIILIVPGMPRHFQVLEDWATQWIHFNMKGYISFAAQWSKLLPQVYYCLPAPEELAKITRQMAEVRELCRIRRRGWYRLGYCIVQEIILRGNMVYEKGLTPEHIELTMKMLEHLDESRTIDQIAQQCSLSRASFFNKFKESFGVSPRVYREQIIMIRVQEMLAHTDLSIKEIANQTGFSNSFYLSNRFRNSFGLTPSQYRKKYFKNT